MRNARSNRPWSPRRLRSVRSSPAIGIQVLRRACVFVDRGREAGQRARGTVGELDRGPQRQICRRLAPHDAGQRMDERARQPHVPRPSGHALTDDEHGRALTRAEHAGDPQHLGRPVPALKRLHVAERPAEMAVLAQRTVDDELLAGRRDPSRQSRLGLGPRAQRLPARAPRPRRPPPWRGATCRGG